MKKILISLSIIGVVATIAIGVTVALFSDTETSTGNIFVAGTMDLKVDHKFASYNGNECVERCVPDTNTNLVQNGSFETPLVVHSTKWDIFDSVAGNWTVEWRADIPANWGGQSRPSPPHLELHRGVNGWTIFQGQQYAELDTDWNGHTGSLNGEPASVKIYQDLVTVPGKNYQLKFAFSPRPSTQAVQNKLEVKWNGGVVVTLGPTAGGGNNIWTEYTYNVTASGALTRLEFTDLGTANSEGTFLDHVRIHPMVCEYQIIGGTCTLWDLKDLGPDDYYWHYGPDMKPGDWGRNIISLHAYDNDAYACLITHNIVDVEDTMTEPEEDADDDIASIIGELSRFINVFAWEDTTQNNAYDSGEPIISDVNTPLTTAIGRISLIESNTKYIGIEWCFGTQSRTGSTISCDGSSVTDIAQTDIMNAYISAYAEQQRNNGNFVCPDWNRQSPP